jgi:hypothetical protein
MQRGIRLEPSGAHLRRTRACSPPRAAASSSTMAPIRRSDSRCHLARRPEAQPAQGRGRIPSVPRAHRGLLEACRLRLGLRRAHREAISGANAVPEVAEEGPRRGEGMLPNMGAFSDAWDVFKAVDTAPVGAKSRTPDPGARRRLERTRDERSASFTLTSELRGRYRGMRPSRLVRRRLRRERPAQDDGRNAHGRARACCRVAAHR